MECPDEFPWPFASSRQCCRFYYDDLDARFAVAPDLLRELQAHNILYDEDGSGRYFQFYGRPFRNGFFFEVVQREGDYNGYGAANAPFRIAAQKRLVFTKGMPDIQEKRKYEKG